MRGKAFDVDRTRCPDGITPAYAGKSTPACCDRRSRRDHPRVCGEKRLGLFVHVTAGWITPAYAGKSTPRCPTHTTSRDHPRVCGEKSAAVSRAVSLRGSPPRMRGKECRLWAVDRAGRITPAYAGKSAASGGLLFGAGDHPRVCGEKDGLNQFPKVHGGSPPRMRGKASLSMLP